MKKLFKLLFLMSLLNTQYLFLSAQQNLVPNPSFEDTVQCPINQGQIEYANAWFNFGDSPDYFNLCSFNPDFSVPNNWGGFQIPAHGNAYAAIGTYAPCCPNIREFIGASLLTPLTVGTRYYISFKVNLSISNQIQSYIATNKMGIRFSMNGFSWSNPPVINNYAHYFSDSIITDTTNWTILKGSFIADSSYQYLTIGNFFDDNNTDTIVFIDSNFSSAYYFIDDICVSSDSIYSFNYNTSVDEFMSFKIQMHPNPIIQNLIINYKDKDSYDIRIYNLTGKLIFIQNNNFNRITINLEHLEKQFLLIQLIVNQKSFIYKFIKN